ncbi:hypothetical protein BASA81_006804 [Batrachochytrium salamandrivorans]|nr:hypothetical protein BASA81_006804 [Batrachochytrium salamandrivorans]
MRSWCLVVAVHAVVASKFEVSYHLKPNERFGPLSEGSMFGLDFGGIVTGNPFVGFEGTATIVSIGHGEEESNPEEPNPEDMVEARLVAFHTSSPALLSIFLLSEAERRSEYNTICEDGEASEEVLHAFGMLEGSKYVVLTTGEPTKPIEFKSTITATGHQYITFVLCSKGNAEVEIEVTGQLAFRNPYGYLSARYYSHLPFYAIMALLYLLLLGMYTWQSYSNRETMMRIQWGMFLVVVLGVIETCSWVIIYLVLNSTGETACCPWRLDVVFATFAQNFKLAMFGGLILALGLGWGVVRPTLSIRATISVVSSALVYLALSIRFELIRMQAIAGEYYADDDGMAILFFYSLGFILAICLAFTRTLEQLDQFQQEDKVKVYLTLRRTLGWGGLIWLGAMFFGLCTSIAKTSFPWSLSVLQWGLSEVVFLGLLARVAFVRMSNQLVVSSPEGDSYYPARGGITLADSSVGLI